MSAAAASAITTALNTCAVGSSVARRTIEPAMMAGTPNET